MSNERRLSELQSTPGVGPAVAGDLWDLDIHSIGDLAGRDPEQLYERLSAERGVRIDRCMLYVFRCAVYYASHSTHEPELLKWWNWKDRPSAESVR